MLSSKVAVITGVASGIGKSTVKRFLKEKVKGIICVDNNKKGLDDLIQSINNDSVIGMVADISKEKDCKKMIDLAMEKYGKLNILFNNAGIMHPDDGTEQETSNHVWDLTMDINVKGVWYGCKYGIPAIIESGGGSIINTASFVSLIGSATSQIAYTASKGAVSSMTKELSTIYARDNIRINALCPGPLNTPLLQKFLDTEEKIQRRLVHVPMGRFGKADEMANAVTFLASDQASYITGTNFTVDGGITSSYVTSEKKIDPFS